MTFEDLPRDFETPVTKKDGGLSAAILTLVLALGAGEPRSRAAPDRGGKERQRGTVADFGGTSSRAILGCTRSVGAQASASW